MNDVVISGAGMVGLTAALALAEQGCATTIIEARPQPQVCFPANDAPIDGRVLALNRASQALLQKLGVWDRLLTSRYALYHRMQVWDSVADGAIHFSGDEMGCDHLGTIVEQRVLLSALWERVSQQPLIRVLDQCHIVAYQQSEVAVTLQLSNGTSKTACLLVAAEGAQSPVRTMLGIDVVRKSYEQTALVATVTSALPHQHTAYQRFAPTGSLAWLPLFEPRKTSIVWSTTPEAAGTLCQLSPEDFCRALYDESAGVLGPFTLEGERKTFPLHRLHAKQYGMGRALLVGDAAHTIHPLAGQGVNCGLRDVACLANIVQAVQSKNREVGSARMVQRYQRHAKGHNQMMIAMMALFHQGFNTQVTWLSSLRNAGLNWLDKRHHLKQMLIKSAQGAF